MEKEQILSEMVAKLGKTSLSQRTISGYVEGNLPTDGVEPDDAYWQKHVGFLKSLDGNFSHDVAHAVVSSKRATRQTGRTVVTEALKVALMMIPEMREAMKMPY